MHSKFAPRVVLFFLLLCVLAVLATPVPEFSNSTAVAEPTGSVEPAGLDEPAGVDDYEGDDEDEDDEDDDDEDDGQDIEERSTSLMKRWSGTMTWFYPGLGHCGYHDTSSKLIVALPTAVYAKGKHCNKYIRIKANGKSVKAKVRDSCPPCKGRSIDVSPAVFKKLVPKSKGGLGKGVQKVSWEFV